MNVEFVLHGEDRMTSKIQKLIDRCNSDAEYLHMVDLMNITRAAEAELAALQAVVEAARVIFEVTDGTDIHEKIKPCPHGNQPHYPAHAWWCDECWGSLKDALDELKEVRKE